MRFLKLLCCLCVLSVFNTDAAELKNEDFVALLQQGGYVIYLRHAATDYSQSDTNLSNLEDCASQRNLSEQSKMESKAIGTALSMANIKLSSVYSSPYCRCIDTAQIAFANVEVEPSLRATSNENAKNTQQLLDYLANKLSEIPAPGTNTVLVSHSANLREVTKIWPKPEGVMHIFKPNGNSYTHVGQLAPDYWVNYIENNKK